MEGEYLEVAAVRGFAQRIRSHEIIFIPACRQKYLGCLRSRALLRSSPVLGVSGCGAGRRVALWYYIMMMEKRIFKRDLPFLLRFNIIGSTMNRHKTFKPHPPPKHHPEDINPPRSFVL
jgi:hypothetical protein